MEQKRNTKYVITSIDNEVHKSLYMNKCFENILAIPDDKRIFCFSKDKTGTGLKANDIKHAEMNKLHYVNSNTLAVKKVISENNIINSFVYFDNQINNDLLLAFENTNFTNDVFVFRKNFLFTDAEYKLIKERTDVSFYLEVFPSTFDLKANYDNIVACFGDDTIVYVYAQWKANKMFEETDRLNAVRIDLRKNKIVFLPKEEIEKDYSVFCKYVDIDMNINDFVKIVL